MAVIHETLTLQDKFSESFTKFIKLAEDSASSTKEIQMAAKEAASQARVLTAAHRVAAAAATAQAAEQRRLTAEYRAQKAASAAAILDEKEKVAKSRAAVAAYREQIAASQAAAAAARQEAAQTRAVAAAERLVEQQKKASGQASETAATAQRKYNQSMNEGKVSASGLGSTLRSLAATYLSFQSVKGLAGMSDQVSQIDARLRLMTGSEKAAAEAQEAIYAAALRSRGLYTDMAGTVAKLGTLAGNAFTGGAEQIVAFAEQLQKQMRLSGTSRTEAQAAMLQLTQGLSSGVLRGEELNSVLEQTPMIAQTIAKYMGVTTGEMRELASQGKVTSDVVVNAILGAAEETNAAFAQLPMTWADVWTQMQNIAIKATQPVLNGVNWLANHIDDALQWVGDNMDLVVAALAGIAAAAAVAGAQMVGSAIASALAWAAANWPLLLVAASIGVVIFAARKMGATWEEIGGVVGTVLGHMYANVMNVFLVPAQRQFAAFANFVGNFLKNPVGAIIVLFQDMALTVLGYIKTVAHGMEDLINKIPGFQVNLPRLRRRPAGRLQHRGAHRESVFHHQRGRLHQLRSDGGHRHGEPVPAHRRDGREHRQRVRRAHPPHHHHPGAHLRPDHRHPGAGGRHGDR